MAVRAQIGQFCAYGVGGQMCLAKPPDDPERAIGCGCSFFGWLIHAGQHGGDQAAAGASEVRTRRRAGLAPRRQACGASSRR